MTEAAPRYCYRHPKRETGLSCSECGRPICTECMTVAPVGLRCPDHSGQPQGAARLTTGVRRLGYEGSGALVTKALIAANVLVYLICLTQGSTLTQTTGSLFFNWGLDAPDVAAGDWWRIFTAMFLHASLIHVGMNMLFLWWIGGPMEAALGRGRFLALYLVSGLAGSAGALLVDPRAFTVGASGAIYGILGAALVFERQRNYVFGGSVMGIVLINLIFSFTFPNVSWGGHLGGLAGGALCGLVYSQFGRGHAAYSRLGLAGYAGVVAVGAASVAVAYLKARGQI